MLEVLKVKNLIQQTDILLSHFGHITFVIRVRVLVDMKYMPTLMNGNFEVLQDTKNTLQFPNF